MNDATLSLLVPSTGSLKPDFNPDITDYIVVVPYSVTSLIVSGRVLDAKATMDPVDGNLSFTDLAVATSSEQSIKVISEDGATINEYKIKIVRESNVTTLSDLTISAGTLSPAFNPSTMRYMVSVPYNVTNLIVTGRTSDGNATMDPPDGNLLFMNLAAGISEKKTIIVTSEYKTITKTYKVRALRQYKISYISENIGELMFIPAGSFQRDEGEENISVITKPYSLSKYQITRQQFLDVMGEDPSDIGSATSYYDPVQMVNWYHAIAFCNKLSLLEDLSPAYTVSGVSDWENLDYSSIPINLNRDWDAATCNWDATGYRLPTEMEWMWAAMGADQDAREGVKQGEINETGYTKDYAGQGYGLGTSVDDYACYSCSNIQNIICPDFFYEGTEAVGKKLPNELGLYDMSGNVWEWCWDWWDSYPTDTQADYKGIDFELSTNDVVPPSRVLRGGSRCGDGSDCSVAFRLCHFPYFQSDTFGFRVLRPIQ